MRGTKKRGGTTHRRRTKMMQRRRRTRKMKGGWELPNVRNGVDDENIVD